MSGVGLGVSADALLAEARHTAGVDREDHEAVEPLTRFVESIDRSASLTSAGAEQKREWIVRLLRNRLRMQRDLDAHPEIDEIELRPPLLVNAMPRTGSTKTQKMLAATGLFNYLPYWMCINSASVTGVPGEDVTPRIEEIERYADWFLAASPRTRFGHPMLATEPEEEAYVMMQSLVAPSIAGFVAAPEYVEWASGQDLAEQYRYLGRTLKYLVWQGLADPTRPFLLKCVVNLGLEAEIRSALPGVRIAMVHRDPQSSVPSAAALGRAFRAAFSDQPVDVSGTPARWAGVMRRHLAHRAAHPDEEFLDVAYEQIRDDASSAVAALCRFAGVEASTETFERIAAWESANPQYRGGAWTYSSEEFGFTDDDVRAAFADYVAWVADRGLADWT